MVPVLIMAALLAAGEQKDAAPKAASDVRTFCTEKSTIKVGKGEGESNSEGVGFVNEAMRVLTLKSGRRVLVQDRDGHDELLVEEDGRYRKIVEGKLKVHRLAESPDSEHLAVAVVYKKGSEIFRTPTGGIYVFKTDTWIGEQIVKFIGFSGFAWSPDSKILAYGDRSKVRFYDVNADDVVESCGVDSQSTADTNERFYDLRWNDDGHLSMRYQNPRGTVDYVVERK